MAPRGERSHIVNPPAKPTPPPPPPPQPTYLDGLLAAQEVVVKAERGLEASPVLGFNKYKFFLGLAKSYLTVYLLGSHPEQFPAWHATQFAALFPVQLYRWSKMKGLAFFTEFCWVANACIACYIASLYVAPHLVADPAARAIATRALFAFGVGPLGTSVVMLGNSLVPHSIDHMMSLLIHLQPAVTAYCIRWKAVDRELFPLEAVDFVTYVAPPLCFLAAWAAGHTAFMLAVGLGLPERGWETTFDFNVSKNPVAARLFGKMGEGSDAVRFLKYELFSVAINAAGISLTYPLYARGTKSVHWGLLLFVCCVSAWNGAGWYHYRITKFSKEMDKLIAAAKKDG